MTSRLHRERAHHDERFAEETRAPAARFYSVTSISKGLYQQLLTESAAESRDVLEYGCGAGGFAPDVAAAGKVIHAIDVSRTGVLAARRKAASVGVEGPLCFSVMDAENLAYADDTFDLLFGSGILHHLDLSSALEEVTRVLRPNGRAVFFEPLGENALIGLYRRLTPRMRSTDEHPLKASDLARLGECFGSVRIRHFHLLSLLAVGLRGSRIFERALSVLDWMDQRLFAVPILRRLAWVVVIDAHRPQGTRPRAPSV